MKGIAMKKWNAQGGTALKILAGAAILSVLLAEPVAAQTRAALVRDVDRAAAQPFSVNRANTFVTGSTSLTVDLLTVPAGKRAVMENLSCIDYLPTGVNFVRMELSFTTDGRVALQQFVHDFVGASFSPGVDVWSFNQPMRAYADPGSTISVRALRRTTAGLGGVECDLSGHYVDVP